MIPPVAAERTDMAHFFSSAEVALDVKAEKQSLLAAPALEERRQRHLAAVLVLVRWRGGCPP